MAEKRRFYYTVFKAKSKPELYWCWLKSFQADTMDPGRISYLETWYVYHKGVLTKRWTPQTPHLAKMWVWEFTEARDPNDYEYEKTNKLEFLLTTGKSVDQAVTDLIKGLRINQVL